MMVTLYLAMEQELLVAREQGTGWSVEVCLEGMQPTCLAIDPAHPAHVYCGTFSRGLWRSKDQGSTWQPIGAPGEAMQPYDGTGILSAQISAVAISPLDRSNGQSLVYVGTEPSALYRSEDGGTTWQELKRLRELPSAPTWSFPPRPYTSHVRWITPDPLVPGRLFVAIEAGALVRSSDHGEHWEDRVPDGPFDTHTLLMHPLAPNRLYSAAGDGLRSPERGYNESFDGGITWQHRGKELPCHYLWGMALDPADPETVVISASPDPRKAHHERATAMSLVARKTAGSTFQQAMAGLPAAEGLVAPVLASHPTEAHTFFVLTNQGVYRSADAGESWERLALPWKDAYRTQHQQALAIGEA